MSSFLDGLRSGSWLTRERMRLVALAVLAASGLGLVFLLATSDGLNDYQGRPLGTDFSNVYAAGTYVLDGQAAAPFDPPRQYAREQAIFGPKTQFYGWHYPPFFLFVAALLALMPYGLALLVWQAGTLALYLWTMDRILEQVPFAWKRHARACPGHPGTEGLSPSGRDCRDKPGNDEVDGLTRTGSATARSALEPNPGQAPFSRAGRGGEAAPDRLWLLLAVAFPAVFVNIGHGHNGFLTAALLGGALVMLDRRPLVAGVLFGLLAYKPQFGLMIPLVLVATGRWRTFAGAALTVLALAAVTTLAFGPEIWRAFLASTEFTRLVVLEQGNTGWHKIQSIFSWVRMWGGSVPLAYAVQGAATLALGAALVWLWRSAAAYPLKAAALCLAAILGTPYSLDYDLVVLAPAIAFLAAHGLTQGFAPWEKSALALVWLMPLIARSAAENALMPLGALAMLAMFGLILRHAAGSNAHSTAPAHAAPT